MLMEVLDLLKGKKVIVPTDAKVDVTLEIESITENLKHRTIQITPDTKENDWYGQQESYTEISYSVKFTNGLVKHYDRINAIKLLDSQF